MGGYLAGLYASQNANRVESLFCISPAGFEAYDEASYNPYKYPDFDNPEKSFNKTVVEGILKAETTLKHPQANFMNKKPERIRKVIEKVVVNSLYRPDNPSS